MFNPGAPYGYLLPTMYLFMADIANSDLFVCGCRTWICLDITRYYEDQLYSSRLCTFAKRSEYCFFVLHIDSVNVSSGYNT